MLKDYSLELFFFVIFLGDKRFKFNVKDKEGNSELFGFFNSYVNDYII